MLAIIIQIQVIIMTDYKNTTHGLQLKFMSLRRMQNDRFGCMFKSVQLFVCLLVLLLYVPVNSYGHYETVSSPNHTFSWASLNKQLTSTSCTYFRS